MSPKKEELETEVKDAVQRMQVYDADLESEIERLQANLSRVQADANQLNLQEAQDHYRDAEDLLEKQYRALVQDRDAIAVVMARAQGVLQVSQRRTLPGREPRGRSPVTAPPSKSEPLPGPMSGPAPLGKEVDDLLSLGPLGQGQK